MVQYSKEFLQQYYSSEWLVNYDFESDDRYSPQEIDELYEKAVSFELLQKHSDKKKVVLPASAYLKLDRFEKSLQERANKQINSAKSLSSFATVPESAQLFRGWSFHDCHVTGISIKGSSVEIKLNDVYADNGRGEIRLDFSGATVLENELPKTIPTFMGDEGTLESDYWWIYEEAVVIDRKKELHVLVEHGYEHMKLAVQYSSVERIDE